ncbi:MAG: hypothetical protein ABIQ40_12930 [Bacteroidia bacterium]
MAVKIPINTSGVTDYIQSAYLHLMAAGSDGADGSSEGYHLRWNLLGNLGRKHLPKGMLSNSGTYSTTIAYNKKSDYVTLFKAAYLLDAYRTVVDFSTAIPDTIINSGSTREWHFEGIIPVATITTNQNTIIVNFSDTIQYDYWAAIHDPSIYPQTFLQNYTGVIEAKVEDKLCFSVFITLDGTRPSVSIFRSEGIAVPDTTAPSSKILSCRKTETDGNVTSVVLRGENLESVRFSSSNRYPIRLSFQCYYDYILGMNEENTNKWTKIDDYCLSITDAITDARLENTATFTVDQLWPRYAGSNPSTGEYTVSVPNYLDKWAGAPFAATPVLGIKEAVIRYLDKSKTDVFATESLASDTSGDSAHYDISYLEAIKLMALDFHYARMFGLGAIDGTRADGPLIYAAIYKCAKDPADETQSLSNLNVFMCLPTTSSDYRLPVTPYLKPITYGLSVDNATEDATQLSDENGYALYDDVRFINLNKEPYPYEHPLGSFYENTIDFYSADISKPVLFGTKYKEDSEGNWRSPELNSDPDYQDAASINEVIPFPETDASLFLHMEKEEGVHDYAIYGINLFSRVSDLSNTRLTDATAFPKRNTLLPPSNFQVQLIQTEDPPLLTTSGEQFNLSQVSGSDKTFVRTTFEWNESHNIAYQTADKIDFYFCDHTPLIVRGIITAVTDLTDNKVEVLLGTLTINSTNPAQAIVPTISSGNASRFAGSQLSTGNQLFDVESVTQNGNTPILVLKKTRQTASQEYPIGSNQFTTTETYLMPNVGDTVMVVENMRNTDNWSTHLAKQVNVITFTPLHTETVTMADGNQHTLNIGGIYRTALIEQHLEVDPDNPPTTIPTGVYDITFSSYSLPTHSDSAVEWYKGGVRIMSDSTPSVMKKLEVWSHEQSGSDLILTVFDPAFGTDPIVAGNTSSRSGVNVNYHPAYRVYLYKDNLSGNNFTSSAILPATGTGSKITYMGIRSIDSTQPSDLFSPLSVPVPLLAREIVTPAAPEELSGPLYATRPDIYGKSTYTFDTKLDTTGGRVPFGLIFFRASDSIILGTLYTPLTLAIVLEDLSELTGDDADYYEQRIKDIVTGNIDTTNGTFKAYGTGTYFLPEPDNAEFSIPHPLNVAINDTLITPFDGTYTLADLVDESIHPGILQTAIAHVFQPLTEQPVTYCYLKPGTKTSAKRPLFRDENGQLIVPVLPTDPNYDADEYDPFPMAVTYTDSGDKFVRFTDYTIDGAAKNIYFYYALEFSNTNTFSGRSPILGAVRLVNTLAPDAPQIRKVTTQLADPSLEIITAVLFEINSYLLVDGIGEYQLYRTTNAKNALNVRTMILVATIPVGETLFDEFADVTYPLYGEALYYRIVAVRFTRDEDGAVLRVPSQPSNTAITNVVDVINPLAPQLRSVNGTTTSTELQEVILKWQTTAYNATYKLQQQTAKGNWVEIYSVKSNAPMQYPPLDQNSQPDFTNFPETELLAREDEDGNPLYHRFRVQVINSSGLINLTDKLLTLAKGCSDLQELDAIVSYEDSNYIINPLRSQDVDEGVGNPLTMKFVNLLTELPAGHNTFVKTDITVKDDLGNSYTQTITPTTQTVNFTHGNGGLILNTSNPNRTYTITTITETDYCTGGALRTYALKYISGPCNDLHQLTELVSLTDSSHTIAILGSGDISNGTSQPGSLAFTDISNVSSLGQLFNGMDITVTDDYGHTYTRSIAANQPGGTVTFHHNDGGLILDNSDPNRAYNIEVALFTDLCIAGTSYVYNVEYAYSPCSQLSTLTDIAEFSDNNGSSFDPLGTHDIASTHHAGGSMTFGDIVSTSLPLGHAFGRIDVILEDGLGGISVKSITAPTLSVTFNHGDGNIALNSSSIDLSYSITLVLYTDICTRGTAYRYMITYLA